MTPFHEAQCILHTLLLFTLFPTHLVFSFYHSLCTLLILSFSYSLDFLHIHRSSFFNLFTPIMTVRPSESAPSTRQSGANTISGVRIGSGGGVRVDTPHHLHGSILDRINCDRPASFTLHFTNIRGLSSNFSSVEHHLASSLPDLFLIAESQLSVDASPDLYQISNYNLHSRFRFKGGVCAYTNINTPSARLMHLESSNFDALWLKICLPTSTIIICFCYCSPNSTDFPAFFNYLSSCHESLLSSHPRAEILYVGDFNLHHKEWLNSTHDDVGGFEAHSFSILHDLEQIIGHPTRVPDRHDQTANILDLFFTSNPSLYSYSIHSPLGSSDHCLISVKSDFAHPAPLPSTSRLLWHFEDVQRNNLKSFLADFPWRDYCFRSGSSCDAAVRITEIMAAGMDAYVPSSLKSFSPTNPWFDRVCSRSIHERERAYQAWKSSPSPETHANFISARNRCKTIIRKAKRSFIRRKCDRLTSAPSDKPFWSLTKNILNNFCNSSFPPLFKSDGSIANSPAEKADLFGSIFSSNSSLDDSSASIPLTLPLSHPMPPVIVSTQRVRRILLSLETGKATGPDGIPTRFLKEYADELAPVLCRLFRLILKTETYPSSWKHPFVQPVPKKGDRSDPSNYRPIALTSTIAKVFESLLNVHFLKHLESLSLLSDHQYGFRKARSTGDLLSYLTHIWSTSLRNFGESFVVALDISKAFDRVWHRSLLAKLPSFGFTPSLCNLISSFLSDRFISVVVDGATSSPFPISSGVPQGSVISPTLFLLFINDLLSSASCAIHSYADDSTLHCSSSFPTQPSYFARSQSRLALSSTINSDLDSLSDWGRTNLVSFNASKTKFLPISLARNSSDLYVCFNNNIIESSQTINILGVNISSNLSWKYHITKLAKLASQKLGILFRCKNHFTPKQLLKLYVTMIRPSLEYCSHIWGSSTHSSLLDRVESKALRLINDSTITSSLDSLSLRRKVSALSLFYRYYHSRCSLELAGCVPPPLLRPRRTRQSVNAHEFSVQLETIRINRASDCFFPATSALWNSLPAFVFPETYDLCSFKRQVCRYLRC